ncbi:MAG: MFS transporter [Deltaproteobacteria bacterium]|nr:MFS transporter [Deltaproteobacteria bacterium]
MSGITVFNGIIICSGVRKLRENIIKKIGLRPLFTGLLPFFILAHCAHHVLTALPVPMLPMIRTYFNLDYTQSGLLISAFSLSYGLGQLPAGWLADRIGPRLLVTMGISGVATAGFFIGTAPSFKMMIPFMILMGLLGGGYHPSAPPLIATSVEPKNLGRALGFHLLGGNVSFFLTPLVAVTIATVFGWRGPFIVLAIPTFIFGSLFYVFLGRLDNLKARRAETSESQEETHPISGRYRQLVVIIILGAFTSAILISTVSFIPLMMVDQFGVSEKTAAVLLSLIYSAGLWAAPISGYLSDRFGRIPVIIATCFLAAPVVWMLNIFPYGIGTWAVLLALGVSLVARMPVIEAFVVSKTSVSNRSTILGIYYFSAMESGGLFTPFLGKLIDNFGFYTSFSLAGIGLFTITLICSFWLWGNRE